MDNTRDRDSQTALHEDDIVQDIVNIKTSFEQLTSDENIGKEPALQIMQLFHSMETLLIKSEHMRFRETAELKHELESMRIRNDHDELKRTHAELEQRFSENEENFSARLGEQAQHINHLQDQLNAPKKKGR